MFYPSSIIYSILGLPNQNTFHEVCHLDKLTNYIFVFGEVTHYFVKTLW